MARRRPRPRRTVTVTVTTCGSLRRAVWRMRSHGTVPLIQPSMAPQAHQDSTVKQHRRDKSIGPRLARCDLARGHRDQPPSPSRCRMAATEAAAGGGRSGAATTATGARATARPGTPGPAAARRLVTPAAWRAAQGFIVGFVPGAAGLQAAASHGGRAAVTVVRPVRQHFSSPAPCVRVTSRPSRPAAPAPARGTRPRWRLSRNRDILRWSLCRWPRPASPGGPVN